MLCFSVYLISISHVVGCFIRDLISLILLILEEKVFFNCHRKEKGFGGHNEDDLPVILEGKLQL